MFRTPYSERYRVVVDFSDKDDPRNRCLTQQQHKDECDINKIVERFEQTGLINHINKYAGQYGDFEGVVSYHDAMNTIVAAREMFDTLPSKVRAQFANDAGAFLAWANDPDNKEQMIEMGLLKLKEDDNGPDPARKNGPVEKNREDAGSDDASYASAESEA